MRWNRRSDGTQSFYLTDGDINRTMEDELRKSGLYPTASDPVLDVERFIEQYLDVTLDQHAELEPTVLGLTEFFPEKRPRIQINRDLTGMADEEYSDVGDIGRWRATLAHEASHVLLHRLLFEFSQDQGILFEPAEPASPGQQLLRCLKRDFGTVGSRDWREVQANKGMAALLMPRRLFLDLGGRRLEALGLSPRQLDRNAPQAYPLACEIAETFQVSRQAAGIRLETLGLFSRPGQQGLALG